MCVLDHPRGFAFRTDSRSTEGDRGFRLIRVDFPAIGKGRGPFRFVNKFFKMSKAGVKVVVTQRPSALCLDEIS